MKAIVLAALLAANVWQTDARWPGWRQLYQDGKCIGSLHPARGVWCDYEGGKWSGEKKLRDGCGCQPECQCDPDCGCVSGATPCQNGCFQNFGVDQTKLGGLEAYKINGKPVTKAQAEKAIQGGQVPDDAHKLRLTVIGQESERKQVLADLAASPALVPFKDKLLVQAYAPDHWAVAQAGFVTTGKPTVYLQAPDGKVLHRQDDYQDGADGLAKALRKADPDYKPDKDQDKRKDPVLPGLPELPPWAPVAGLGGLVLLLLLGKRN